MAPPALPADEVVPEIQAEMRRILLLGRPTYSIGLFSAAAILGTVLWPHVDHRHLLVWLALALGCAALFTVAVYGPLARRTRADGVPVLMDPANVASGIVFGAVTWVDPHALAHSDPVPWICVAGLFALSAGSTIGSRTATRFPVVFGIAMWTPAFAAFAYAGQPMLCVTAVIYLAVVVRDGTTSRRLAAAGIAARVRSEREALTDPLTGLANRAGAFDAIDRLETRAGAGDVAEMAVMFVDLDRFKQVNDRFGHAAGDALLAEAGSRLTACVRDGDVVARVGGDEFVILLPVGAAGVDTESLSRRIIRELERPFRIQGRDLLVSASVGVASAPIGTSDADALIARADQALYHAKREGRRRAVHFHPALGDTLAERTATEMALRAAVPGGEIVAFGQPVVRLGDGEVLGIELLARWTTRDGVPVPPTVFVPLAEELGLVRDLGRQMLAHGRRAAAAWADVPELAAAAVGINISPLHVADGLVEDVRAAIAAGLPADRLVLEVTETAAWPDEAASIAALGELAHLGVRVAVDDFGAGFSSIRSLGSLPARIVKLDRSLLHEAGDRRIEVLRSLALLASALDRRLVAEGIEDEDELADVISAGIDIGQGYGLGRPVPLEQVATAAIAARARVRAAVALAAT